MAVRTIRVAVLLSIFPVAGCGTVANLAGTGPEGTLTPFGGVRQDAACIRQAAADEPAPRPPARWGSDHYPRTVVALFCAADLPFSFVGDMATWPYTKVYSFINRPVPVPPVGVADRSSADAQLLPAAQSPPAMLPPLPAIPPMPTPVSPGAAPPTPRPVPPAKPGMQP
ncbi:MAG: hypothetical protein ACKODX_02735 [Gemmata sp.]